MIIIKTKTGDIFVNDKEIVKVTHNRELHTAEIYDGKAMGILCCHKPPIEHVESVNYINEQTGNEWKDNGSHVEQLQRGLADRDAEIHCCYEMNKKLEDNLRSFASEMIQIVQYNHEQMPADICKQMRDHGEEMKAIANDEKWLYRRQWLEAHRMVEASESDATDKLHKTIEAQAAEIREMKDQIECMEANERMRTAHQSPKEEPEEKKPWWYRLMAWFD